MPPSSGDDRLPPAVRSIIRATSLRTSHGLHRSRVALSRLSLRTRRTAARLHTHLAPHLPALSADYLRGGLDFLSAAAALSLLCLAARRGLLRIRTADDIPAHLVRRRATLHAVVVSVRDGDGLRVRHLPWLRRLRPSPRLPPAARLSEHTIAVRLAAVDAPESLQRFGKAARDWLREYAIGSEVAIKLHSMDRYRRVVATVYRKHRNPILRTLGLGRKNLSLELTRAGYATLYDRAGAQYGSERMKKTYMAVEAVARRRKVGMWADTKGYVSPMDYKEAVRTGTLSKLVGPRIVKKTSSEGATKGGKAVKAKEAEQHESLVVSLYNFAKLSYQYLKRYR